VEIWVNFEPAVCVPRHTHRRFKIMLPDTEYAHEKNITSNFSQARSTLPEDGSKTIQNTSG